MDQNTQINSCTDLYTAWKVAYGPDMYDHVAGMAADIANKLELYASSETALVGAEIALDTFSLDPSFKVSDYVEIFTDENQNSEVYQKIDLLTSTGSLSGNIQSFDLSNGNLYLEKFWKVKRKGSSDIDGSLSGDVTSFDTRYKSDFDIDSGDLYKPHYFNIKDFITKFNTFKSASSVWKIGDWFEEFTPGLRVVYLPPVTEIDDTMGNLEVESVFAGVDEAIATATAKIAKWEAWSGSLSTILDAVAQSTSDGDTNAAKKTILDAAITAETGADTGFTENSFVPFLMKAIVKPWLRKATTTAYGTPIYMDTCTQDAAYASGFLQATTAPPWPNRINEVLVEGQALVNPTKSLSVCVGGGSSLLEFDTSVSHFSGSFQLHLDSRINFLYQAVPDVYAHGIPAEWGDYVNRQVFYPSWYGATFVTTSGVSGSAGGEVPYDTAGHLDYTIQLEQLKSHRSTIEDPETMESIYGSLYTQIRTAHTAAASSSLSGSLSDLHQREKVYYIREDITRQQFLPASTGTGSIINVEVNDSETIERHLYPTPLVDTTTFNIATADECGTAYEALVDYYNDHKDETIVSLNITANAASSYEAYESALAARLYSDSNKETALLFDYIFPLNRYLSMLNVYCTMITSTLPGIEDSLLSTKERLYALHTILTSGGGYKQNMNWNSVDWNSAIPSSAVVTPPPIGPDNQSWLDAIKELGWTKNGCCYKINGMDISSYDFKRGKFGKFEFNGDIEGEIGNPFKGVDRKNILKMLKESGEKILKQLTELGDPNIAVVKPVYDLLKTAGVCNIPLWVLSIASMPMNIIPPPFGFGPPITPFGIWYVAMFEKEECTKEFTAKVGGVGQSSPTHGPAAPTDADGRIVCPTGPCAEDVKDPSTMTAAEIIDEAGRAEAEAMAKGVTPDTSPAGFACTAASAPRTKPCGKNLVGEQTQTCANGFWSPWSACADSAAGTIAGTTLANQICTNGDIRDMPCGTDSGGHRIDLCTDGTWAAQTECLGQPACKEGDQEAISNCGKNQRDNGIKTCVSGIMLITACNDRDECVLGETKGTWTACGAYDAGDGFAAGADGLGGGEICGDWGADLGGGAASDFNNSTWQSFTCIHASALDDDRPDLVIREDRLMRLNQCPPLTKGVATARSKSHNDAGRCGTNNAGVRVLKCQDYKLYSLDTARQAPNPTYVGSYDEFEYCIEPDNNECVYNGPGWADRNTTNSSTPCELEDAPDTEVTKDRVIGTKYQLCKPTPGWEAAFITKVNDHSPGLTYDDGFSSWLADHVASHDVGHWEWITTSCENPVHRSDYSIDYPAGAGNYSNRISPFGDSENIDWVYDGQQDRDTWYIMVSYSKKVRIHFKEFDTESYWDALLVYGSGQGDGDWENPTWDLAGQKISGQNGTYSDENNRFFPLTPSSEGAGWSRWFKPFQWGMAYAIMIKFWSDGSVNRTGFIIDYIEYEKYD